MAKDETPEEIKRWFLNAIQRLWPIAMGSVSLRKSPCIRGKCSACASGIGHSSYGLSAWFQRLAIPAQTRSIIDCIRSSGPSRHVGGGRSNVSGRYPSRKMGVTIQFESHRVELAGVYEMEHDAGVLEYFDQPPSIKLDYASA